LFDVAFGINPFMTNVTGTTPQPLRCKVQYFSINAGLLNKRKKKRAVEFSSNPPYNLNNW